MTTGQVAKVVPGQIWRDLDPREHGLRTFEIVSVSPTHAIVRTASAERDSALDTRHHIRLNRFSNNSRGYSLVSEALR